MAAGPDAGVEGVEKAADTLPPVGSGNGVGDRGAEGGGDALGSGIDVRDGGVSGAPNVAPGAVGVSSTARDAGPAAFADRFSSGAAR